jgi:hypothetical protein
MTYIQKMKRLGLLRKKFKNCILGTNYSKSVHLEIVRIVEELNKIDKQVEANTLPVKNYI